LTTTSIITEILKVALKILIGFWSDLYVDNFHELSFDDAIVLIQTWYNFFANGHRQSSLHNIPKNETLLVLIRHVTR